MLVRDIFRLSFHNLLLHKIRSLLTSLGVIFGVGSVISMLAISEGAKRQALEQIEAMGIDKIIVYSKPPALEGKDATSGQDASSVQSYGLTVKNRDYLRDFENVDMVTTMRNARKVILKGTRRLDVKVVSTDKEFLDETNSRIVEGRWLSTVDSKNKAMVCVIGRDVKRKLFALGGGSVIGEGITVENAIFQVVGVIENNLGTTFPELGSPNDMILIPSGTSEAVFGFYSVIREGRRGNIFNVEADVLIIKVSDISYIDNTAKRISSYLERERGESKDWGIQVPLDLLRQKEETQNIFTIVMGSIAGISLIVGGIGIMNIMLANVYERRKEIGTRRALGAKKRDILAQFLIETVFLTSLGGVIGIGVGLVISQIVARYADWPIAVSHFGILLSISISGVVGVVFGTYPAWKAAQQNPIDALRSE
ncbi:MAG: ABC transporter permease [Victivallales bacterium]|nr:ABC transporter permease [Victivallales bacterium]